MKFTSRDQIETLAKFKSKDFFTTSFFIDTSKNRLTKKEIQLSVKNLLNNGKIRLEGLSFSKSNKESLLKDLEKIKKFCSSSLPDYSYVGLSIFSCSGENFWQVFNLVKSPRNMIVFDHNPYVRPLSAILEEYHRICLLTINRKEAKWYDIYMGEIEQIAGLEGDVPSRIKEGGWEGYSSKRIERHMNSKLHDFFKKAAKQTYSILKNHHFEWLFLACRDDYCTELEPIFHPEVKKRIKTRIKAAPGDSPKKILKEVLELKNQFKKEEKEGIITLFEEELIKGGLAVSGLKNTLRKLNRGEIQTLLVTRHFSKPGKVCPKCQFLYADEAKCPTCRIKTQSTIDVIDEAVEAALNSSSLVKHINPPSQLDRYGGIGAFLRYKT